MGVIYEIDGEGQSGTGDREATERKEILSLFPSSGKTWATQKPFLGGPPFV